MFIVFSREHHLAKCFDKQRDAEVYCAFRDGHEIINIDDKQPASTKQEASLPERLYFVGRLDTHTDCGFVAQTGFFTDVQKALEKRRELIGRVGSFHYVYVCAPWQEKTGTRVGMENTRRDLETTRQQIADHVHEMKSIANRLGSELLGKMDSLATWATE